MSSLAEKISDAKYTAGAEIERTYKQFTRLLVPSDEPLTILDIGCGTGINAEKLSAHGHKISGVDISSVAIEKFRQKGFEGQQCDITKGIPYEDGHFDLVFASDIIEHLADSEAFLNEIYRLLRSSGQLVLSTINSAFWAFRLFSMFGYTVSEVQHHGHIRFFSKSGLVKCVTEAGFESVKVAGRNMYFILSGKLAHNLDGKLQSLGFRREIRFRTQTPFWHLSHFSRHASSFWSDALILSARKPPG